MLTIERIKELIGSADLSDSEAEQIRDECRIFAEIIFEQWLYEKHRLEANQCIKKQTEKNKKAGFDKS